MLMLWGYILLLRMCVFPQGDFVIKASPFNTNISRVSCPCLHDLLKKLKIFRAYANTILIDQIRFFSVLQSNLRSESYFHVL